jgi:hypothetical protein
MLGPHAREYEAMQPFAKSCSLSFYDPLSSPCQQRYACAVYHQTPDSDGYPRLCLVAVMSITARSQNQGCLRKSTTKAVLMRGHRDCPLAHEVHGSADLPSAYHSTLLIGEKRNDGNEGFYLPSQL